MTQIMVSVAHSYDAGLCANKYVAFWLVGNAGDDM